MAERQPKPAKFTEASSSSTSVIGNNYYVFLSFRGPDTRKGFVDHLYHRLNDVGLRFYPNFTFRDDEDLPFGEDIATNLLSAIKSSKVSIPVISENYAASKWCLREIIQIMECVERGEQKVYPVLYKVEPDEVKKMQGKFGDAFNAASIDEEVKRQGRQALEEAVDPRIFESEKIAGGHEGKLVKALVETILRGQQHDFQPRLPVNLVGIDGRVAEVMKLVDTDRPDTCIIGIYGMGGIGKTTLATIIYNKLFDKFEHRSFLKDIRETIKRKSIEHVQSRLISDILNLHDHQVPDPDIGINTIQSLCTKKEVLILLDDVNLQDHLDKLIGGCSFMSGSTIIITCRDKALLKSEYKSYELKEVNHMNSLLLFSRYAFELEQPPTEFTTLSSDIVATTGGLPLALVIIGSFLKRKDKSIWTETLEKLRKVPHTDVQEKLKISYDSLVYQEQQMFLDIACFFIGIDKRIATYLWKDLQLYPDSGLARMIELSLIKYDDNNELRMHDQLRDLGRAITHPASKKPWDCSRLWDEEALKILRRKEENRNIEALRLDENGSNMFMKQESFKRMPDLKFLRLSKVDFVGDFEDSLSELRWLEWEKCPNFFEATNVHLEKLLILDLSDGDISEDWGGWRSIKMERLKVLNLYGCIALKRTPNLSAFKNLEMLILKSCQNLEEIDPSIGDVECLTSLNLSNCWRLKKLPSQLGELKALVSLNLSNCWTLKKLPSQLGELKALVSLNLTNCCRLKKLPSQLGELKALVSLNLRNCGRLKKLPSQLGELKKLEILNALGCKSLVGLPDSIGQLVNLLTLDLRFCCKFKGFSKSIGSLVKLQCLLLGNIRRSLKGNIDYLDHSNNFCLDHIPDSIGKLESLTELHLTYAKFSELPESIGKLKKLKILKISRCAKLSSLPSTISELGELEELDAIECDSLEGGVPINGLSSLKILRLGKVSDAVYEFACHLYRERRPSPEDFTNLSCRQHLDLTNCNLPASLTVLEVTCHNRTLPELSHLIHLEDLNLQFCECLESIPVLPSGILRLWVFWCDKLKELPNLSSLELLSELRIVGCNELEEIRGLEGLKSLGKLSICGCKKLSNLKGLEELESLRDLEMRELDAPLMNDDLSQVQCLGRLKNLKSLRIDSCQSLIRLDISQLTHLQDLWFIECENIVEIKGLERLKKLRSLNILECNSITHLSLLNNLEELVIIECPKLLDVQGQVESVMWYEGRANIGESRMNLRRSGNQGV